MATVSKPLAIFTVTGKNLGDSEISRAEVLRWKGAGNARRKFETKAVVFWHRFRKACAGAYRRRRVEIDIFTLESSQKRQRFIGTEIGYHWPSEADS